MATDGFSGPSTDAAAQLGHPQLLPPGQESGLDSAPALTSSHLRSERKCSFQVGVQPFVSLPMDRQDNHLPPTVSLVHSVDAIAFYEIHVLLSNNLSGCEATCER